MNKKLLLSIICTIFVASGIAQKTFKQSDLVGKWTSNGFADDYFDYFEEYTDTGKVVSYVRYKLLETNYYLSDDIEKFDKSKVYENTEGKYFIYNYYNEVFEILSLTDEKLILKGLYTDIILMYTANEDSIFYAYTIEPCEKPALNYENLTQQTFKKSDIANKKWFSVCSNNWKVEYDYYLFYTKKKTIEKLEKNTRFRYILLIDRNANEGYFYKIIKLTDSTLILKHLFPKNSYNYKKKFMLQAVKK